MGADIHWIAERKHSDGQWEAAFSDDRCRFLAGSKISTTDYWGQPQDRFGDRDYMLFGLLSNVRGEENDLLGEIATQGLPADASEFTVTNLNDDGGLHSQGHYTYGALKSALHKLVEDKDGDHQEHIETLREHLDNLEKMIEDNGPVPVKVDDILFGSTRNGEYESTFPDMAAESNHEQLARSERIKGLLPISEDTLRICIAYDS